MTEYIGAAVTAKYVRASLKQAFPGVKFSVRTSKYAGGASIHISWTDGPLAADVDKVAHTYAGAGFDGMIDLKTHNSHWLYPDGHAEVYHSEIGHSYGSTVHDAEGDRVPEDFAGAYLAGMRDALTPDFPIANALEVADGRPEVEALAYRLGAQDAMTRIEAGARVVSFGADYIFTERQLGPEAERELQSAVVLLAGESGPFDPNRRYEFGIFNPGERCGRVHAEYGSQLVYQLSRLAPELLDHNIAHAALRRAHNAAIAAGQTRYLAPVAKRGREITMRWLTTDEGVDLLVNG